MQPTESLFTDETSAARETRVIGERVAQQLAGISDRVRDGSERLAVRLDDAAGYLRGRNARDFATDLGTVIRNHPLQTALTVGAFYLVWKLIRR